MLAFFLGAGGTGKCVCWTVLTVIKECFGCLDSLDSFKGGGKLC